MSYCRWSDTSDVYLIRSRHGERDIWVAHLVGGEQINLYGYTPGEMATELRRKRDEGVRVPDCAFERLDREQAALDAGEEI